MGLVVYWYDFVCFGIVGVAFFGALGVIWWREGAGNCVDRIRDDDERLLVGDEGEGESNNSSVSRGRGHVSSSQLWSTCWRGLHPIWLLALRFASFFIMSGFLLWDILKDGASVMVYYTEWTFTLVIVYFAIASIVSAHGCVVYYSKKPPSDTGEREEFVKRDVEENGSISTTNGRAEEIRGTFNFKLQSQHYYYNQEQEAIPPTAGFWGYLMQTAFQTCAGAVIITDIVFWCIIVPFLPIVHCKLNLLMGCMHTVNAVLLLLDTSVNSLPFPWFRLAYFVLWSCCYVIFQWAIHACGYSMWPYPFLELSTPWAPLWYFCLAVLHIPCYGLYSLLEKAKNSVFPKLFPHAFVKSY